MKNPNLARGDVPLGLGMALAQNMNALEYFASLTEEGRRGVIESSRAVRSKEEMEAFVNGLSDEKRFI